MIDYSFLRLKDNFDDAKSLSESPAIDLSYAGQIHLVPNETYLQISNSETNLVVGSNYRVFFVDQCGNDVREVTDNVFINAFQDSRGIWQIAWEFINQFEHFEQLLYFKFVNPDNNDTWWTNGFITTNNDKRFTARYDYKSNGVIYGIDYTRADFYQSIRLSTYFNDDINESTREKYYQISDSLEVSGRNNENFKEEYIAREFNKFTLKRLELMLTNDFVYIDNVRTYSNDPIEFEPREGDSNWIENPFVVSKDNTDRFTFEHQIFEGLIVNQYVPTGYFATGTEFQEFTVTFNVPLTLGIGSIIVYNDADALVSEITVDSGLISVNDNVLTINTIGSTIQFPADDGYYVQASQGIVSGLGIEWDGISDSTTWTFTVAPPDYDPADYDSNDYFTN